MPDWLDMLRNTQHALVGSVVTGQAFNKNCQIYLTALVVLMVSHQTCINKPAKKITGMADHDCVAYSNTVESIFTQYIQLSHLMSWLHYYSTQL